MKSTGLSKLRLERMHRELSAYVDRKEAPGLVALVSRDGDVHRETLGNLAFGNPAPMKRDLQRKQIFHTPGRFGWTGGFGTSAYTDPAEGLIGILFTQRMMDSPKAPKVYDDFWTLAYAAME